MREELDLLKKAWKKDEHSYEQVTENQIYAMIHKRSSSIVKWILMISIVEFIFFRILDLSMFFDDRLITFLNQNHLYFYTKIVTITNIIVLTIFIYFFYKNFKSISVASSVKKLMHDIIKTRQVLKIYVWYNLILIGITSFIVIVAEFKYNTAFNHLFYKYSLFFILCCALFIGLMIFVFWLFYKIIYGVLLMNLKKNYKELEKINFFL
jgi:hypothetical protein